MSARAAIYTLIVENLDLRDAGLAEDAVLVTQAVDTPTDRPFLIIRWEEVTPSFGRISTQRLSVWVHDHAQDYTRVNTLLEMVKDILLGAVHVAGEDGWILTQADWRGDSGDLVDLDYGTVMRSTSFDVVARYTTP